ncbi:predicted protein [Botrytis cinerea T4]|uniref:Uncharacterized protein n=1 Tax=Botryotinia fuckeliana (strain T4) TaxID=999810 RepID=G2XUN1_BOTF4|nr:predicted protein [Botrytis cinerea T4]
MSVYMDIKNYIYVDGHRWAQCLSSLSPGSIGLEIGKSSGIKTIATVAVDELNTLISPHPVPF